MTATLYQLLGVQPNETAETIERICAQRLSEASDHNTRVVLRHAKEVLCNPVMRAAYDTKLREPAASMTASGPAVRESLGTEHIRYLRLGAVIFVGLLLLAISWLILKSSKPSRPVVTRVTPVQVVVVDAPATMSPAPPVQPELAAGAAPVASPLTPETLYATLAPSVVVVESLNGYGQPSATGSGVVIGPERVITNCHVISRAGSVKVRSGSAEYTAISGTSDTHLDLCVLQVSGLNAPEVKRGTVKELRVGQTVYAIGAPQGLDRTLSQGLVSSLRETPEGAVIQTSAAISPGSSGGGLFDVEGRLVGITTFQTKSGQNLNFAVPVDWLEKMQTR